MNYLFMPRFSYIGYLLAPVSGFIVDAMQSIFNRIKNVRVIQCRHSRAGVSTLSIQTVS